MKHTIEKLRGALSPLYEPSEVKAIIRLLLEEVCGLSYSDILLHANDKVLPVNQSELLEQYAQRLSTGEPVQQVMGYTWFRGRKFLVNRNVLTPRPETEELVQMVVDNFVDKPLLSMHKTGCSAVDNLVEIPNKGGVDKGVEKQVNIGGEKYSQNSISSTVDNQVNKLGDNHVETGVEKQQKEPVFRLMDIGTGSGCIALSLAAEINHSFITAVDLSTEALKTAKDNAEALNINNIEFVQMDILKAAEKVDVNQLSTEGPSYTQGCGKLVDWLKNGPEINSFDAIVSNPPYICEQEAVDMSKNVLDFEPSMALFVPDVDPLLFYRVIGRYAQSRLKPGGKLYFEINEAYGPATCNLLKSQGYEQVQLYQDFYGKDRFVSAVKKSLSKHNNQ